MATPVAAANLILARDERRSDLVRYKLLGRTGLRVAMDELRTRKPWIPEAGQDGVPVRDEIELVRDL